MENVRLLWRILYSTLYNRIYYSHYSSLVFFLLLTKPVIDRHNISTDFSATEFWQKIRKNNICTCNIEPFTCNLRTVNRCIVHKDNYRIELYKLQSLYKLSGENNGKNKQNPIFLFDINFVNAKFTVSRHENLNHQLYSITIITYLSTSYQQIIIRYYYNLVYYF